MRQRHPAASLRVPGVQAGGMRRIAPGGAAPVLRALPAPTQGGATPQSSPHQARRRAARAASVHPPASHRQSPPPPSDPTASVASATVEHAVATLLDDLAYAANQPGSYQRMGGF
jgi:hypothetical protein